MTDEDNRMIRRSKDKPPKGAKPDANALKGTSEERLLAKLRKDSLKVHGDPLDTKKKRPETKGN